MTDFPQDDPQDAIAPAVTGPPADPRAAAEPEAAADAPEPETPEPEAAAEHETPEPETPALEPAMGDTDDDASSEPPPPTGDDEAPSEPPHSEPHNVLPPPHAGAPRFGVAPPPIRRIYRSRHDRKLGGVSGGIAEFFRIDPTIVRLATLVLAISGIGILVYLVAWVIIPLRPEGHIDPASSHPTATDRNVTIAFGVATLAVAFGIVTGSWVVLAFALVGGGLWLLSQSAPTHAPATVQGYAVNTGGPLAYAPPQPPPSDWAPYETTAGFPPPYAHDQDDKPRRERTPQRVTWIVLALLMLLAALGITAAADDWWDVSGTRFLGLGVFIIAVGIVVGQVRGGGARGLIPLGVLAVLALFPVSAVDGLLDEGVGTATYRPTVMHELESRYEHGIGQMTVDLSQLDFDDQTETIDIDLGIGELIVIVSDEAGGRATLQAKGGEVSHQLPNTDSFLFDEGLNVKTGTLVLGGDNGMLELNISVGFGTAELRAAAN